VVTALLPEPRVAMRWTRKLSEPITLKDGRTLAALGEAREMMLSLPPIHRRGEIWRYAAELLKQAADDHSYVPHPDAETQLAPPLNRRSPWIGQSA
jgi:hypothetical protein